MAFPDIKNEAAEGVNYFTPAQKPAAGTVVENNAHNPKLFQPLTIRGVTLQNRIMLSPLCQYSSENGHATDWHLAHIGGIVSRGPGLTMVEATSVTSEGRITPEDAGLWLDSQIAPLKKIVDFAHSQNQKIGIQLGHAGRKGSTVAPWLSSGAAATKEVNGWPDNVLGPSAIPYNDQYPHPKEMTKKDIESFKQAFVDGVKRALKVGFDVIEIHNAHGYLLHSFVSPATNKRTDEYGGSFENRTRLTREIVELTRAAIPKDMPLFIRISGTDFLEEVSEIEASWTVNDSVKLAGIVADLGVDLIDVSGGGLHPLQKIKGGPAYQAPFAKAIKDKLGDRLKVSTVGSIENGKLANKLLEEDGLDVATVGRGFLKDPFLVWTWADELGVSDINLPNQIRWAFKGRGGLKKK